MYCSDKQFGRTRVNQVLEGLKTKKTHVQHKKTNVTGIDKLFLLQKELFRDGLNLNEYVDYLTDKIQKKNYYYRGLNSDNIDALKKRYGDLIERENMEYNRIGDEKELNRKRRKQFREKKRNMVYEKRKELIRELFKVMKSSNSIGVLRNTALLSDDPDKWNQTKKTLFLGGRHLETQDKEWVYIYKNIVSQLECHLFNLHSHHQLNRHVFEN
jgi:hypothetical protein